MIHTGLSVTAGIHADKSSHEAARDRCTKNAPIHIVCEGMPLIICRKVKAVILFLCFHFEGVVPGENGLSGERFSVSMGALNETDDIFTIICDNKKKVEVLVLKSGQALHIHLPCVE